MSTRVEHRVAGHFDSAEQEFDACKVGMWLFLVTEVLMFGGLFVGYAVYRSWYPDTFLAAHHELNRLLGAANTLVLICSSFTMAMAVRAAQTDKQGALKANLVLTILFACAFMVVKYFEYTHKIHEGLLPGALYHHEGIPGKPQIFFTFYFMMTGLHGFHILVGIGVLSWILWRSMKGQFYPGYFTPVEMTGLYWHLVDLIWIFLFPLFYLIG
ncbi:MAG: cytochrome c oxidase subunit 3 family protein [Planctomycetota bacterium]